MITYYIIKYGETGWDSIYVIYHNHDYINYINSRVQSC